jgi:hypothetical protein
MKTQRLQLVIFLFLLTSSAFAQNARPSQLFNTPMLVNPALTGRFDGKARLGALYSYQQSDYATMPHYHAFLDLKLGKYKSSGDEPLMMENEKYKKGKTGKATAEAKDEITKPRIPKGYWGVGVSYYHYGDNKSPLKADFISASVARHFYYKRNRYFGFGLQGTYAKGNLDEKRGIDYDKEISGGGFRYPQGVPSNRIGSKDYVDFSAGAYYGKVTDAVAFELGISMYHLFYPKNDIFGKDDESKLRHRITAHSMLRLRLNDQWGFVQKNIYWEEGLYYRSKTFNDSLHLVSFWSGVEFYKTEPKTNFNLNFGFYTRSFRTLMPLVNVNLGRFANLRGTYELPLNAKKFTAYRARRAEVSLILTMGRNTTPGSRFYKKTNFW